LLLNLSIFIKQNSIKFYLQATLEVPPRQPERTLNILKERNMRLVWFHSIQEYFCIWRGL